MRRADGDRPFGRTPLATGEYCVWSEITVAATTSQNHSMGTFVEIRSIRFRTCE